MQAEIPSIDEMPALKARLGKARTDRIRYVGNVDVTRQKYATNLNNTVLEHMQHVDLHRPGCEVTDILTGMARLDGTRIPLSVDRLFNLFVTMPVINTREIMKMTGLDKRQAQRYLQAAKIALPFLQRIFQTTDTWFD